MYYVSLYICYKYYGPQSMHGNQPDVEKELFRKYQMGFPYVLFYCLLSNIHMGHSTHSRKRMYVFTASSVQKVTQELA